MPTNAFGMPSNRPYLVSTIETHCFEFNSQKLGTQN